MITVTVKHFSIAQICDSGQCFRMEALDNGGYQVVACGRRLVLEQSGDTVRFHCERQEYEDLWEMIISFIISQQNNIKRIRKCIRTVCEAYGAERDGFYDFPTPEQLAAATEAELRGCGLGYRSRYLTETARMVAEGEVSLKSIREMKYKDAREELLKLPGIGVKVADCICLFALHHLDAFPVDTHIRQVLDAHYPKGFPVRRYKGCRGVMQQYIFYYDLMKNGRH